MSFQLIVLLPEEFEDNPAFARVAGVTVITRLVLGAVRAGAKRVTISGSDTDRARQILQDDERLAGTQIVYDVEPPLDLPQVRVRADVIIGNRVWEMLNDACGNVSVPGAPLLVKSQVESDEAPRPLWQGANPKGCYVQTVHDRAGRREAKREIFRNITKPTSGPVSRHLNSRFSIPLSKLLVETPMTPNQMTLVNTLIGVIAAYYYSIGDFAGVAIGGLLMQLGSVLDRNDGEIARCKMMESERGAWFDTFGDNITYLAFMVGLTYGYAGFTSEQQLAYAKLVPIVGFGSIAMTVVLIAGMFLYVHKNKLGGTMTAISRDFRSRVDQNRAGFMFRLLDRVQVMGERDQFTLVLTAVSVMPYVTGNALWYHILFFSTFGFLLAANIYFALGWLKARSHRQATNHV